MASVQLFGKKIPPACKYCRHGDFMERDNIVLCVKKGIVMHDYRCRHFIYDPLRRIPAPPPPLPQFCPEDFSIEPQGV